MNSSNPADVNLVHELKLQTPMFCSQDVFPTDFGPDYDGALQVLMLDFLSRLERLLPVPDIQQVLEPVWRNKLSDTSQIDLMYKGEHVNQCVYVRFNNPLTCFCDMIFG